MKNIKLVIEYEGTNYSGWQRQENFITIQQTIEDAIESFIGENVSLLASGRTDKGVHALGQVANFKTSSSVPGSRYKYALKEYLPEDITIVDSEEVDLSFHSRFDAKRKIYRYKVYNSELPRALYRNFYYHFSYKVDIDKMIQASKYLLGTHDFRSFMGRKCSATSTTRHIYSISIERKLDFIEFTVDGNSFLRNMVRIIVGTLLQVGIGRFTVSDISDIMNSKKRENAGITAPAQGLYLEKVFYK